MKGRLAWVLLACVGVLAAASEGLSVWAGEGLDGVGLAMLSFPIVGALIVSRRPGNAIGWIMLLGIGASFVLSAALGIYAYYGLTVSPGSLPGPEFALALDSPLWVPFIGLSGTFLILLFPDGRLPSPRWRPWAYFCALAMILCYTGLLLLPASFTDAGYPAIRNPLGIEALRPVGGAVVSTVVLIPIAIIGCAVALIRRFRRSDGLARVQLKWFAAATGIVATAYATAMVLNLFFGFQGVEPSWLTIAGNVAVLSFALIPISVGIAILRHRLYDIDVIINRTLVYGGLTVTLTAAYFAVVTALEGLLRPISGQSELAVAGSTLTVSAIFRPARRRIQTLVDRRFYRSKFDAAATLQDFSARLREEVDLEALTSHLLTVVDQTMKPATSSLWLRQPGSEGTNAET